MRRIIWNLAEEPTGEVLHQLLEYALTQCKQFLLVTQETELKESGIQVLKNLEPFLLQKSEESQWPGTLLCGEGAGGATVYQYKYCPESAAIIKGVARGLYDWLGPDLPEDLCLMRSDGSPWLVTISHEKDAYLELSVEEKDDLIAKVPGLKLSS